MQIITADKITLKFFMFRLWFAGISRRIFLWADIRVNRQLTIHWKKIRSAVETGHQHCNRHSFQHWYAHCREQDIPHRLHQVSSSFLWQQVSWQALQARQWGQDHSVPWWYGTEGQWSYLSSGGAMEADRQLLSESCHQRWCGEDARSGELPCWYGKRNHLWVYGIYLIFNGCAFGCSCYLLFIENRLM